MGTDPRDAVGCPAPQRQTARFRQDEEARGVGVRSARGRVAGTAATADRDDDGRHRQGADGQQGQGEQDTT
jgi:hypothetical protein